MSWFKRRLSQGRVGERAARAPDRVRLGCTPLEERAVPAFFAGAPKLDEIGIPDTQYSADGAFRTVSNSAQLRGAIADAPAGATIVIRGGVYRNVHNVRVDKPLTLQPAAGEEVWLNGAVVAPWTQTTVGGKTVWVTSTDRDGDPANGYEFEFPHDPVENPEFIGDYALADNREMVFVNGVSLRQVGGIGAVAAGTFWVDYAHHRVVLGTNPANKFVEVTAAAHGLILGSASSGAVVRGIGMARYADAALVTDGPGRQTYVFENNTFAWNGRDGVDVLTIDGRVTGNRFVANGMRGLRLVNSTVTVEGNTFSFNNVENYRRGWAAAGLKTSKSSGTEFRDNLFADNFTDGLWIDVSCLDMTVTGNTMVRNDGAGVFVEISHNVTVAGNTLDWNGNGVRVADSSNVTVRDNTMRYNGQMIKVFDTDRTTTNPDYTSLGITWVTRNVRIIDNDFFDDRAGGVKLDLADRGFDPNTTFQNTSAMISEMSGNTYNGGRDPATPVTVLFRRNNSLLTYTTLGAFQRFTTGFEDS